MTEAERIERQSAIARAIRAIGRDVHPALQSPIADRALLIEVADSDEEVLELLAELAELGVDVERAE